eukprot:m.24974 g.24974  ORF g.24974 m.24974 type:complete len:228 (+) comp7660_c0_seq3:65-748(+)
MASRLSCILALLLIAAPTANAGGCGLPIPSALDGNALTFNITGVVEIEVFWDWLCPDSRAQSVGLLQASAYYGSKLRLKVHPYPLPYHRNGFFTSWASYVVRLMAGVPAQMRYGLIAFENQEALYNINSPNVTQDGAFEILANWAELMELNRTEFLSHLVCNFETCDESYIMANTAWKYGAGRATGATPTVYVNGIEALQLENNVSLADWKVFLDPYINPTQSHTLY